MRPMTEITHALVGAARRWVRSLKNAVTSDSAPSLVRYRLNRLWRRRGVRRLATVYAPILAVIGGVVWLGSNQVLYDAVADRAQEMRDAVAKRPEFAISTVEVVGATSLVESQILTRLDPGQKGEPVSSMDVDTARLREEVESLGWVRTARVTLIPPDRLQIDVDERIPAAVWRSAGQVSLIDPEGAEIEALSERSDWSELPLVVGPDAAENVSEALTLLADAVDLSPRIIGFVRVGERRWDIHMTEGMVLMLPAEAPREALGRILLLHRTEGLLDRDLTVVDYRAPDRPTVRLDSNALERLREMRDPTLNEETDA